MTDEQIKEVMRLSDEVSGAVGELACSTNESETYESIDAARAALEAYLRTIGEPAGYSLPAGSIGAKKFAQVGGGFTPVGLVFSRGESAMAITEHGRVYWDRDLVHPISGEPESVNAELLEALKYARRFMNKSAHDTDYLDAAIARAESATPFWPNHPSAISDPLFHQARGIMGTENFGQEEALRLAILHVLNARAESAIETPAKVSPCAGHAVQQEADEAGCA